MPTRNILSKVVVKRQLKPQQFLKFMTARQKKGLLRAAFSLRGKRVVHVSATPQGGGVAEIMKSLIPYLRSLGVQCDWYAISGNAGAKFFETTNKLHNALQGAPTRLTGTEWKEYGRVNRLIAAELERIDCDVLVINDPQPLMAGSEAHRTKHKIYMSHIDTSAAFGKAWRRVLPFIKTYHRVVFSNPGFVHGSLPPEKVRIFTPAIDPLSPKQAVVSRAAARAYLERRSAIPAKVPLIVQVSRFDIWKNPLGVIAALRLVQEAYPEAHLALVGFNEAKDNPIALKVYRDVAAVAHTSPHVSLFFDPRGKNTVEFTAMAQNGADVVVQNSIKEGFGLTVTEAMWKRQPVVGGPALGLRRQIRDGKNGFIAKTQEELARRIVYLLEHPKAKRRMGEAARATVARNFLMPRLVTDHLRLYRSCLGRGASGQRTQARPRRGRRSRERTGRARDTGRT